MSKKLDEYTKDELLAYVRQLQKYTKFGLVWNPKEEQVAVDCKTKVPVLQEVLDKTIAKASGSEPTHLLLEGDNYHSLSVLNYTHAGKIDVIYIDPPYNTGSKDFIYNDRYVNKDDPYRHSEWLSFMDNRLRLAKNLLADTGVIFISIDDNEQAHLKVLCDTIFGEENFIDSIVWDKKSSAKGVPPKNMIVNVHEYILAYQKGDGFKFVGEARTEESGKFKNPDNDPRGPWRVSNIKSTIKPIEEAFTITDPNTGREYTNTWAFSKKSLERMIAEERILWKDTLPKQKEFMREMKNENMAIKSNWGVYDAQSTTVLLKTMLPDAKFDNPKPMGLMEYLIKVATDKNATILDFFAGSGTTGHAVLKLNAEDGGRRQFILGTNNENGIAENITYERINKVINGYNSTTGIPANLRYFKTDFVDTNGLSTLTDKDKLEITKKMGAMIALRENSFDQVEQTSYWQTYENPTQLTAIYYREDKTKIDEYVNKLNAQSKPVKLYVFGWGKNAGTEYASKKISVEDIPEPLIEVYKEIAK